MAAHPSRGQPSHATVTPQELALLGLQRGDSLPEGGVSVVAIYNKAGKPRTGSSSSYLLFLNPLWRSRCGVEFVAGSFNLWTEVDAPLGEPLRLDIGDFWPIILEERAVGVVFRQGSAQPRFLEVFSPVVLKDRLGTEDGQPVNVRLLFGTFLR